MADQLPDLPWEALASHFRYIASNPSSKNLTNLFPLSKPTQDDDIRAFTTACAAAIHHHATLELAKYPETYPVPPDSEVLLSDDVVRRISPFFRPVHDAVGPFRSTDRWDAGAVDNPACRHPESAECACLIPYADRTAAALMREKQDSTCHGFWERNDIGVRGWELVRVLLVRGELEPLLRLRGHERFTYHEWWQLRICGCASGEGDSSSDRLYERALLSFLCLSILRRHPETWPSSSSREDGADYRLTKMYQHTLRATTKTGEWAALPTVLHRPFFGVAESQFDVDPRARDEARWAHLAPDPSELDKNYPEGLISYEELLSFEAEVAYAPHADDVPLVRETLSAAGNLPVELVDEIMRLADYVPRRRLKVAHDPFHKDNGAELDAYLAECWAVVVRCEVFARAMLDEDIRWDRRVGDALWQLLHVSS